MKYKEVIKMEMPINLNKLMEFIKIKPFEIHKKEFYLWYNDQSTKETGEALANKLGIDYGYKPPTDKHKYIIGWGMKEIKDFPLLEFPLKDKVFINSYTAIQNNRKKFKSLELMKKSNVKTPKHYKKEIILDKIRNKEVEFPLIARRNKHQEGNGLKICLCIDDVKKALNGCYDYFVEYVRNYKEFRIHIFNGKPIRASKKTGYYVENNWVRNNHNGWKFKDINIETISEWDENIIEECKKAVKSMNMVFGAVDIVYSDFNEPYVIEVNSSPALNGKGLDLYADCFIDYINNKMFKGDKK